MAVGKRQRTADDPADDALLPGDGGNDDASEEALVEVEAEVVAEVEEVVAEVEEVVAEVEEVEVEVEIEIEVEVEVEEFVSEVEPVEAPKADL